MLMKTGACVSPRISDNQDASVWFNCVEELVFDDKELCDWKETKSSFSPFPTKSKIQALQAAYMVCLYQNWEGTDSSKARIRRNRYNTVVSCARVVGIDKARHLQHRSMSPEVNFADFVIREELIRVFLWIFLLDTAFVIFNNVPPRMSVKEMKMDCASPERLFQASSSREWLAWSSAHEISNGSLKNFRIDEIIKTICRDELDPESQQHFANLGPLNLFAITSAIHSLVFQFQNSFNGDIHPPSIKNALSNWEVIWSCYETSFSSSIDHCPSISMEPSEMWKRVGFMKHAKEYWMLARLIVIAAEKRVSKEDSKVEEATLASSSMFPDNDGFALTNYDETSMQQVNQLISDLQEINING